MKITPQDKQQALKAVSPAKPHPPQEAGGFRHILDNLSESMRPQPVSQVKTVARVHGMATASRSINGHQDPVGGLTQALDHLERYQHLLGDAGATMRALEPAVKLLKQDIDALENMLASAEVNDRTKSIIHETLVVVSKEITRFEQGEYVEG